MRTFRYTLCLLVAMLAAVPLRAQVDRADARASLTDLTSVSVDATVEGPEHLVTAEDLQSGALVASVQHLLQLSALPVVPVDVVGPNLGIHLNMQQIESGLIAFSVELDLIQHVLLINGRQRVRAITWNESLVGLVSHDMTSTIADSVLRLADSFIRDLRTVN